MKPIYFKSYDQAVNTAESIPESMCVNQYQSSTETKRPKVKKFDRGYAVQLGDYGPYVTKETLKELNIE